MKHITIKANITIRNAMKIMSSTGEKSLVIVNSKNKLLGTLSDGDLRKAILKGASVEDIISNIYNNSPTTLADGKYNADDAENIFINNKFDLIPIIDHSGKLTDVLFISSVIEKNKNININKKLNASVVIMAGGKGSRLEPFTKVLPKALIPIEDKPIIDHIMDSFASVGVVNFILTVNYKARLMKAYFEELSSNYNIEFVEEESPLGTAGCLKFLENRFDNPIIVTNCDIIIKVDYSDLYEFHLKNNHDITLVASIKKYTIPYGTCELDKSGYLNRINEKPKYDFLVNTGLYILSPGVIELIPSNQFYHMTQLIDLVKEKDMKVGVFPIDEDAWIDIGQWAEYRKAIERL